MIQSLTSNSYTSQWVIFHIVLGLLTVVSKFFVIGWFYFILILSLNIFFSKSDRFFYKYSSLMIYLASFELLGRMTSSSPFLPDELGKYLLLFMLTIAISIGYKKNALGWALVLLLIPGTIFGYLANNRIGGLVFNVFGAINIGLSIIFFPSRHITEIQFFGWLRLLLYPILTVLTYVIIKTPNYGDMEFNLTAQSATVAGFGSNQVSTALGLGIFLIFLFIVSKQRFSGNKNIDIILLGILFFQGLLTFSRGGILGGVISIGLLFTLQNRLIIGNRIISAKRFFLYSLPIIIIMFLIFRTADNLSNGNLTLRYKGETSGTLSGYRQRSLTTVTSNRDLIFMDDIQLFIENPINGVGVGQSNLLRANTKGQQAHIEISRLLSEHGIFGLIYLILLSYFGLKLYRKRNIGLEEKYLFILFILAIFTSSHAALRTYITPVLIGISAARFKPINLTK